MTKSPLFKFLIGLTAGLCAAVFPRLAAALAAAGDPSTITLFNQYYVLLSLGFATIVGLVVMILEWGVPKTPANTFMMALGIPALLTGGFNTSGSVNSSIKVAEKNEELVRKLSDIAGIPVLPPVSINPIPAPAERTSPGAFQFQLVGEAFAGNLAVQVESPSPWIQMKSLEQRYVVVLDHAKTVEEGSGKARALEKQIPNLRTDLARSGQDVLIIERSGTLTKSDALLEAIRLKEKGLSPQLLELR